MDNWHDAKTDPPKKYTEYIATWEGVGKRHVRSLTYNTDHEVWEDGYGWIFDVLYWMDFPDPKED